MINMAAVPAMTPTIGEVKHNQLLSQHVGPRISVGSILEVFYAFFTNTLLLEIVHQTNLYAEQCYQLLNKDGTWETSAEEIAAYLGITILMGINRHPDLYDYWSTSPDLHCFQ